MAVSLGGFRDAGAAAGTESGMGTVSQFIQLDQKQKEMQAKQEEAKVAQFDKVLTQQVDEVGKFVTAINTKAGGIQNLSPEAQASVKNTIATAMKATIQQAKVIGMNEDMIAARVVAPFERILQSPTPEQTAASEGRSAVAKTGAISEGLGAPRADVAQAQGLIPAPDKAPQIVQLQQQRDSAIAEGRLSDAKQIQEQIKALGDPAGVSAGATIGKQADIDKQKLAMDEVVIAQTNINQTSKDVLAKIAEGGEGAVNFAGDVSRGIEFLSSGITGVANNLGVDISKFESGESAQTRYERADKILKSANVSAEIKSALTDLAYSAAAANGQEGRGVSDKDFENNLKQLGAGTGGANTFQNTLVSFVNRSNRKFENRISVMNKRLPDEQKVAIPKFEELKAAPIKSGGKGGSVPEITTQEQFDALPSGSVYIDGGKRYKKP